MLLPALPCCPGKASPPRPSCSHLGVRSPTLGPLVPVHRPRRAGLPASVGPGGFCLLPTVPATVGLLHTAPLHRAPQRAPHQLLMGLCPPRCPAPYHGRTVVVVFVTWLPGLEAAPAESVVAFGTGHATEEAGWSVLLPLARPHQGCQGPRCTADDVPGSSMP